MLKYKILLFLNEINLYNEGMNKDKEINIFSYLDYRKFLQDYYQWKKKTRGGFSLRTFSKKAGFGSSNILKRVVDGERNLTENSIVKFAKGLELNKTETDFFRNLVNFCQAKSHEEKDYYYQKIIQSKNYNDIKPMEKEQYEFCSEWYHPIVRELVVSEAYNGLPEKISERITPKLTVKQIESSIELLEKIGLIKRDENGKWIPSNTVITTGSECESLIVMNYHKNLLSMTQERLDVIPADQRYVNSLVLGIDKEVIPILRKKIKEFSQEILKLVSNQENPTEVLLLTNQLIPYTQTWKEKKS